MFDRVSDISSSLTGGSGGEEADPGELPALLHEDEVLVHALANGGSIEHTTDGRTTTVEPSGSEQAFMLVTDERILYVLGDQTDEPEIVIDFTDFDAVHVRKGLLNSKLQVKTYDEEVQFAPKEGDIEAAEDYVDRVGSCWADMAAALGSARRIVAEIEEAAEDGRDDSSRFLDARSNLSKARRCATRDDDAPSEKIRARVDEVEVEVERRHVAALVDRAETFDADVETALSDGRYEDACESYTTAAAAIEDAREAAENADVDLAETVDRLDALEEGLRVTGEAFLDESDAECETALAADDATVAVDAWEDAYDRYSAAVDAGWNGHAPVSTAALEFQLTWVTSSLLDALGSHASMLEQEADDAGDDDAAQQFYDDAVEWYERAESFADDHPEREPEEFADAADRVEDKKLERSGWEFGNA